MFVCTAKSSSKLNASRFQCTGALCAHSRARALACWYDYGYTKRFKECNPSNRCARDERHESKSKIALPEWPVLKCNQNGNLLKDLWYEMVNKCSWNQSITHILLQQPTPPYQITYTPVFLCVIDYNLCCYCCWIVHSIHHPISKSLTRWFQWSFSFDLLCHSLQLFRFGIEYNCTQKKKQFSIFFTYFWW